MTTRPTRPDTLKVLTKAVETAKTQVSRLDSAVAEATAALTNSTLTSGDVGLYKEALKSAAKLVSAFTKAVETSLPSGQLSPAKRGRPPKAKDDNAAPAPKAVKAKAAAVSAAPAKKRGRPPKAKVETAAAADAPAAAPKKRGRPPKAKAEAAGSSADAPSAAPKKRGRPPKAKPEAAAVSAAN